MFMLICWIWCFLYLHRELPAASELQVPAGKCASGYRKQHSLLFLVDEALAPDFNQTTFKKLFPFAWLLIKVITFKNKSIGSAWRFFLKCLLSNRLEIKAVTARSCPHVGCSHRVNIFLLKHQPNNADEVSLCAHSRAQRRLKQPIDLLPSVWEGPNYMEFPLTTMVKGSSTLLLWPSQLYMCDSNSPTFCQSEIQHDCHFCSPFRVLISLCLLWSPFPFVFPSAPSLLLLVLHLHKSRDPTVVEKQEPSAGSRESWNWAKGPCSMSSAAKALTTAQQAMPVRTILSTPKAHAADGEDYRQVNRQLSFKVGLGFTSMQSKNAGVGNKEQLQNPQASGKTEQSNARAPSVCNYICYIYRVLL